MEWKDTEWRGRQDRETERRSPNTRRWLERKCRGKRRGGDALAIPLVVSLNRFTMKVVHLRKKSRLSFIFLILF